MKGETHSRRSANSHLEQDICIHIFTVSSAMVGVCLAADALLFLISCLLSYWALRSRGLRRMHRLERIADAIFIIAMIGMVVICALITYTISVPVPR
jgi:membrane-anchored protein YejM (alkaline phosphatase superfamily)